MDQAPAAEETTNLHEEPTQVISWNAIRSTKNSCIETKSDHVSFMNISDQYNDENLPLQEHYSEIEDVANTEVIDLKKSRGAPPLDDDESTDCEVAEIMNAAETSNNADVKSRTLIALEGDETTDCEGDDCEKISDEAAPQKVVEFDTGSNESMEFLNSKVPLDDESIIDASNADLKEASAECDDSNSDSFAPKLKRKSAMVIETQESDSETEVDVPPPSCFEDTIPATQYQSIVEFNDSDIVPATQDMRQKNPGSSEESFKLGLTELITESSQGAKDEPLYVARDEEDIINGKNADIYDAATQKIPKTLTEIVNADVYLAPVEEQSPNELNTSPEDKTDIYDAPTQKIVSDVNDDDTFLAPTQKVIHNKLCHSIPEEMDIYEAPTQAVSNDIFLAPTQKMIHNRSKLCHSIPEETDMYDAPTQAISNDTFLAPTQKVTPDSAPIVSSGTFEADTEIFEAPTQKIIEPQDANDTSLDLLVDQPKETEIVEAPTGKVIEENNSAEEMPSEAENSSTKEIPNGTKANKKTFNFKKKACNLDASLSSVLVDKKKSDVVSPKASKVASKRPVRMSAMNSTETSTDLNATTTDANKSVALLESKIIKTRKSRQAPEVSVSVPKRRRSKSLLKIEETPKSDLIDSKRTKQSAKPRETSKRAGTRNRHMEEVKKPVVKVEDLQAESIETLSKRSKSKSIVKVKDSPAVSSDKLKVKRKKPLDSNSSSGTSIETIESPSKKRKLQVCEATSPEVSYLCNVNI